MFYYLIPIAVVSTILIIQKNVIRKFLTTETTASQSSKTLEMLGLSSNLIFRRLLKRNVIMEFGENQYYLDEVNLQTYKKLRIKVVVVSCMTILAALILINI